jgi:hypothetical protein
LPEAERPLSNAIGGKLPKRAYSGLCGRKGIVLQAGLQR